MGIPLQPRLWGGLNNNFNIVSNLEKDQKDKRLSNEIKRWRVIDLGRVAVLENFENALYIKNLTIHQIIKTRNKTNSQKFFIRILIFVNNLKILKFNQKIKNWKNGIRMYTTSITSTTFKLNFDYTLNELERNDV